MQVTDKMIAFVKQQYSDNLVSFYEYGAQENQHSRFFLIVLKSVELNQLRPSLLKRHPFKASAQFTVFTQNELLNSIDVFPVEFLEMQQTRHLLAGTDCLADIEIHLDNLRHECEYTLRSTILKLRSAVFGSRVGYSDLIAESYPVIYATLKCLFTLQNKACPADKDACLLSLTILTGVDMDVLDQMAMQSKCDEANFQRYLDGLSQLTCYVNAI